MAGTADDVEPESPTVTESKRIKGNIMSEYITWVIENWAMAVLWYMLAGQVCAVFMCFMLTVQNKTVSTTGLLVAVLLPAVYLALLLGEIAQVLIDKIGSYRRERAKRNRYR